MSIIPIGSNYSSRKRGEEIKKYRATKKSKKIGKSLGF